MPGRNKGIPWDRVDEPTRTTPYLAALTLTLPGMALLLLGLLLRRARPAPPVRAIGLTLTAMGVTFVAALWLA